MDLFYTLTVISAVCILFAIGGYIGEKYFE